MIVVQSEKEWICVSVQLNHFAALLKLTLQYKSTTLQYEIKIELKKKKEKLVAYYKKHPPRIRRGTLLSQRGALHTGCDTHLPLVRLPTQPRQNEQSEVQLQAACRLG